jgi:hypothetical protein
MRDVERLRKPIQQITVFLMKHMHWTVEEPSATMCF